MFVQTVALQWRPGVKALTWRIIHDSYGVLTHSSNTKGVTGWKGAPRGVNEAPNISAYDKKSMSR